MNNKQYVFFRLPKILMEKVYKRDLIRDFAYYSYHTVRRYIWGECSKNTVENKKPIHIDQYIQELEEFRDTTYKNLYNNFMNRKVVCEDYFGNSGIGVVEDISLESNVVNGYGANICVNFEGQQQVCYMFKREMEHYEELREEKDFLEEEFQKENYPDLISKYNNKKDEELKIRPRDNMREDELCKYLSNNINLIEEGMKLIGKECDVEGGVVDLFAYDKDENLCVIELKVKPDDQRLVYQCLYYPMQFDENVRMIAICPDYDPRIKSCLEKLGYVEMKRYEIVDNEIKIFNCD